ncbi:NAD(+) diphosphatase [Leucothrix sargassi]|nr:NAD(+) diphosphatase [Leucothrix sargassi]
MDNLRRSMLNTYTAQPLDRASHGRQDTEWLTAQYQHPEARYLVLSNPNVVTIDGKALELNQSQFQQLDRAQPVSLLGIQKEGRYKGTPVFMFNVSDIEGELAPLKSNPEFKDKEFATRCLRDISRALGVEVASMYSYAKLLNHWQLTTKFCVTCGSALKQQQGGLTQKCSNEACAHIEFPRINPAVIMRITNGDKILLARQETWPERRFSVLAGFVELGEPLESAVQREVMEEVGLPVHTIQYHSSQPWPYPNSYMLGYTAEASTFDVELEQDDITQAIWLTAEELREKNIAGEILTPPNLSISYRLIDDWFKQQTGVSLDSIQPQEPWFVPEAFTEED